MSNGNQDRIIWEHFFNTVGGINSRDSLLKTPKEDCLAQRNIELVSGGFKKANGITRWVEAPLINTGTYLQGTIDPTTESDPWTGSGDASTLSFSGGVMTNDESAGATGTQKYHQAEAGFTTGTDATVETRMLVQDSGTLSGVYAYSIIVLDDATDRFELVAIESGGTKSVAVLTTTGDRTVIGSYSNVTAHDWTAQTRYRAVYDASGNVDVYINDMKTASFSIAVSSLPASTETSRVAIGSYETATVVVSKTDYVVYKIGALTLDTLTITGVYDFEAKDGTRTKIVTAGTKLFKYNSTNADWDEVSLGTAFTSNADVFFTVGREDTTGDAILIMTTSSRDTPQKFDGTNAADLGGTPPNGKYCAVFNDRTWIANTATEPTSVSFSGLGNSEDDDVNTGSWDTTNDVLVPDRYFFGECTGSVPLGGSPDQGNVLLVFFERGIKRVTGWGKGSFLVETVSARHGCIAPKSLTLFPLGVERNEGVGFRDTDGYYWTNGQVGHVIRISEKVLPTIEEDQSAANADDEVGWYNPERSLVGWSYRTSGGSANDESWGFDYFHAARQDEIRPGGIAENWGLFDYNATAAGRYHDSAGEIVTVYGNTDGVLYKMDKGTNWDLSDYEGTRTSAWFDAGSPTVAKSWRYLVVHFKAVGDYDVNIEWFINWQETATGSKTINIAGESFLLGTGVLGTDRLGTIGHIRKKFELNSYGNSIKLRFYTSEQNRAFTVYGYSIGYQVHDWMDSSE